MRNAPTNTLLDATSHYEKHTRDLDLLFDALDRDARLTERYKPEALKRIKTELRQIPRHFLDKQRANRVDPFLNPEGQRHAERQAARTAMEALDAFEGNVVARIQAQEAERRNTFLAPKRATDPIEAITQEMRYRELRDRLAGMDPLMLQSKLRTADDVALAWLPALDSAPVGFEIVPSAVLAELKSAIAERLDPQVGELAGLRSVYQYAVGIARQTVLQASGLDAVALTTDSTPVVDSRQAYTVSGAEVKA